MTTNIHRNVKNQKGFTLVELIVVIAILGILAAIAVPKLTSASDSARGAKIVADLRTIDTAIEMTVANGGTVSTTVSGDVTSYLSSIPTPPKGDYKINLNDGTTKAGTIEATAYSITSGRASLTDKTGGTITADVYTPKS
jgi:prepilin-type N-terminal cleavage/methylation domain-containing protein